jgi:hypothetical protein
MLVSDAITGLPQWQSRIYLKFECNFLQEKLAKPLHFLRSSARQLISEESSKEVCQAHRLHNHSKSRVLKKSDANSNRDGSLIPHRQLIDNQTSNP